ncbi:MAG: signal peptidase I [Patescibacteria group bacterium]
MKYFFYTIWEIIEVALIAIVSVIIIRSFIVQPFLVYGSSMEPNFHNNDYLLIDEISYRFKNPERGEVIVFKYPGNENYYYIKRIIGLPGEEIQVKDGKITIFNQNFPEGFVLDEDYIPTNLETTGNGQKIKLEAEKYFVLGDNRQFSFDSRGWGPLSENEIIGMVRLRLWPLNKVMAFEKPAY